MAFAYVLLRFLQNWGLGGFLSIFLAFCLVVLGVAAAHGASLISDLQTDRARYAPGTPVIVAVTLTNPAGQPASVGSVRLTAAHLQDPVTPLPQAQPFRLAPGTSQTLHFTWHPPPADFQGYTVSAQARHLSGHVFETRTTAVDVSSQWTKFPRYGYLSGYPQQAEAVSLDEIRQMKDYHLNAIQFYDWQWRHEKPLAGTVAHPAASWKDLAGRPTYRQTILDLIAAGHACGMAALNYNLLYGAWAGYGEGGGVDYRWGLWNRSNGTDQYSVPMPQTWQTPRLYLFNPANPGWQNYLIGEESKVFAAYPFDGWQVDQLGPPNGSKYDASGSPVDVWKTFTPFLHAAKAALHKSILFNNVGGYGLYDTAANAPEEAVYVECWPFLGQKTYADLKTTIDQSRLWSSGKAVILAAYMDYDYSDRFAGRAPGRFNVPGVLLTDAAIFAAGGSHIELGDGSFLLDKEYYPNHNLVPAPALKDALRRYYDFGVAYENLLRGENRADGASITLNVPQSADAAPNTVWAFAKISGHTHVLHLINLMGEADNSWRDTNGTYPVPTPQTNIVVKYYGIAGTVNKVYWASPDAPNGQSFSLPATTGKDDRGSYIQFTVPSLAYWDMIYFDAA